MKTTDFSGITPQLNDALQNGGIKAQVEVRDLFRRMDDRLLGQGAKLAAELGLKQSAPSDMFSGPSMDERGNWFDQQGNRIENPDQNENLQNVADYTRPDGTRYYYDGNGLLRTFPDQSPPSYAPRTREMTPDEALTPLAKWSALRAVELGAPIVSSRIKLPGIKNALDAASIIAGINRERVEQNYLANPLTISKKEKKKLAPTEKSTSKLSEEKQTRPRTPQKEIKPSPQLQNLFDKISKSQRPHFWE